MPNLLRGLQVLVTIALLVFLIGFFDWHSVWRSIVASEPGWIAAAGFFLAVTILLGAFDIWVLLGGLAAVSFSSTLRVYVISMGYLLVVPGSVGDAVQLVFFRRAGIAYREGATVYLIDKGVTLVLMLLVAAIAAAVHFSAYLQPDIVVGTALVILVVLALAGAALRFAPGARAEALRAWLVDASRFSVAHRRLVALNALGTVAKLATGALVYWATLRAVGTPVNFDLVVGVTFLAGLVAYVPIAFNGVGTVEVAAIGLYGSQGIPEAAVLAVYLIVRVLMVVVTLAGVGLTRRFAPLDA